MAPQNGWLEDEFPFWEAIFSGAMLVSGRVVDLRAIDVCLSPEQFQAQHGFMRMVSKFHSHSIYSIYYIHIFINTVLHIYNMYTYMIIFEQPTENTPKIYRISVPIYVKQPFGETSYLTSVIV